MARLAKLMVEQKEFFMPIADRIMTEPASTETEDPPTKISRSPVSFCNSSLTRSADCS